MNNRLLVSTRKGLFVLAREAGGWIVERFAFLGENVTLTHDARDGWYAALNLGHFGVKLKYSPDAGLTWEDRAVPAYPAGETIATGDGKPPTPAALKLIWSLESDAAQPERLWAGTAPGGLFRSADGGRNWELVRSLWDRPERAGWMGGGYEYPGIHSLCRDTRNPKALRLAVSTGGVWLTEDDGANWELLGEGLFAEYMPPDKRHDPSSQDVHMMTQCRSMPDCMWIQHHNGVFRSTDGGRKWEHVANASPTGFGFGVVVHPEDGHTAWFVPAVKDQCRVPVDGKLVVSRTRDGGKTFEVLRAGLPQENSYDLVYRHALAIDETGNRLAMGSTTGGLWISEDQGEHWQALGARLPPVHAVRFAA
jgi:photosystem II stability/assembly factor-like uncharacterized protein